jgi:hypothetical protein
MANDLDEKLLIFNGQHSHQQPLMEDERSHEEKSLQFRTRMLSSFVTGESLVFTSLLFLFYVSQYEQMIVTR